MNDPKGRGNATMEKQTLVEEGTQLKGSVSSTCPVVVMGSIEGNIEAPSIAVSATGTVSGKVETTGLKSAGKLAGTFEVDTAQLAGTVESDTVLRASSIDLKLTATRGKLQLTFGPEEKTNRRA